MFNVGPEMKVAMIVLPLTILANILLGAGLASVDDLKEFDWKILFKGVVKGVLVYLAIMLYALVSNLMSDLTIEIMGDRYSLVDAMYLIILSAIYRYGKDGISKAMKIFNFKSEDTPSEDTPELDEEYNE